MAKKPENPYAFPLYEFCEGMTLRDYFAGQALTGILTNIQKPNQSNIAEFSEMAYKFSDAMLAEREKSND